mmetsp:Transcript_39045/g.90875  ORF Transcript_39045/g.90875 Transcript_39045/m.90875 type:complete len:270 (-) Transcript_39045:803-1612(-)
MSFARLAADAAIGIYEPFGIGGAGAGGLLGIPQQRFDMLGKVLDIDDAEGRYDAGSPSDDLESMSSREHGAALIHDPFALFVEVSLHLLALVASDTIVVPRRLVCGWKQGDIAALVGQSRAVDFAEVSSFGIDPYPLVGRHLKGSVVVHSVHGLGLGVLLGFFGMGAAALLPHPRSVLFGSAADLPHRRAGVSIACGVGAISLVVRPRLTGPAVPSAAPTQPCPGGGMQRRQVLSQPLLAAEPSAAPHRGSKGTGRRCLCRRGGGGRRL